MGFQLNGKERRAPNNFLSYQWAQGQEFWENVCLSRNKMKLVELILCNVSIVLVRTKYLCTDRLWNTNCFTSLTPPVNYMFLYLHLKLEMHDTKMNKIHIFICSWLWLSSDQEHIGGMHVLEEKSTTFTLFCAFLLDGVQRHAGWSWNFILEQPPVGHSEGGWVTRQRGLGPWWICQIWIVQVMWEGNKLQSYLNYSVIWGFLTFIDKSNPY